MGTAVSSGAMLVVTFLTGIVLARALGPDGRGDYGTIQFWGQFGILFLNLSLYDAMILRVRARNEDPRVALPFILRASFGLFLFATGVTFGASTVGIVAVDNLSDAILIGLLVMVLAIGFSNQAFSAVERADLSFGRLNTERVLSPALFMLAVLVLAAVGAVGVVTVVLAFALSKLPVLFARIWRFRRHLIGPIDRSLTREVLRLGPRLHMATGTLALAAQVDRIAVVSLWPADWIGFYFVAYSAAGAGMSLASQAIQITLLPHFSGLDIATKRAMVERVFRLALVAGAAVAVPVFAVAPWIVPLAYGADFAPASDYVRGVVVAMAFVPALWVVNVANRAGERGRSGVEMALAALAVFGAGWLLTGFAQPVHLFVTMTLANLASIAAGLRHLAREGAARPGLALVPGTGDVLYLARTATRYAGRMVRKGKR